LKKLIIHFSKHNKCKIYLSPEYIFKREIVLKESKELMYLLPHLRIYIKTYSLPHVRIHMKI